MEEVKKRMRAVMSLLLGLLYLGSAVVPVRASIVEAQDDVCKIEVCACHHAANLACCCSKKLTALPQGIHFERCGENSQTILPLALREPVLAPQLYAAGDVAVTELPRIADIRPIILSYIPQTPPPRRSPV